MEKINYNPNDWALVVPEEVKDVDAGTTITDGEVVGISYKDVRNYGYMFLGSEYLDEYENEDWFEAEAIPAHYPGGGYFIRIDRLIGEKGFVNFDKGDRLGNFPKAY